jgi:hypothetical protein
MTATPTILFLDSNSAGNRTRFLARQPEEYRGMHHNPLAVADEVTVVDTLDVVKLLRHDYSDVVATIAFDELRVVQAAMLAESLAVPHYPPVPGLVNVRFKDRMRSVLDGTRHALPYAVCRLADAPATSPIGYPCVVKPIDEAASTGVRVCHGIDDYAAAVDVLRALVGEPNSRGYRLIPTFLVEEYVDGDEYSAELVWSTRQQDWRLIGFTQKRITLPPWCLEIGELFPHRFDGDLGDRVLADLRDCLRLLGLRETVIHLEFRMRGDRPYVIDVNPRSAGDRIPDLVEHALGVDLVALHLAAHLGRADALLDSAEDRGFVGVHYVVPPRAGMIDSFEITPSDDPALLDLRTVPTPVEVGPPISNSVQTAQIVARGDSPAEVLDRLARHAARITHRYGAAAVVS